ncbi:MAG: sigma-70 family RNA polymerase sigma factor [Acidimicrobiia bacterium]|nr:sigma-70 family RNA polymerase sigma factor [Acidimicrobiia bacterium]NNL27619.1 sigma-70 family RNA polymerase sigma factor [Acidimicrobiia bacterium]
MVLTYALQGGAVIAANVKPDLDGLLQRTAHGDRDAFADLYDAISGAVFGTARSIVRDYSMAEEIAHDVLLEIWTKADRWDRNRGTAATWIMIMTRRRAIDRVRSEQSARDRIETVGASSHNPDTDVVSDTVIDRSQEQEVVRLLGGLTELQREAVQLAFYEHKTHAEISKLLGVPLGTIKSRIRDGLMSLEHSLGQPK